MEVALEENYSNHKQWGEDWAVGREICKETLSLYIWPEVMRAWIKLVAIKLERKKWMDLRDVTKEESELEVQIWLNICQMVGETT